MVLPFGQGFDLGSRQGVNVSVSSWLSTVGNSGGQAACVKRYEEVVVGEAREAAERAAGGAADRVAAMCTEAQRLLDAVSGKQPVLPPPPRRAVWFVAGVVCVLVVSAVVAVLHPRGPLADL